MLMKTNTTIIVMIINLIMILSKKTFKKDGQ